MTTDAATTARGLAVRVLVGGVRAYQRTLGPLLGGQCRFAPTCSAYAIEALETHGARRGAWLALRRLCRCHPWGPCGDDPVPPAARPRSARRGGAGTLPPS